MLRNKSSRKDSTVYEKMQNRYKINSRLMRNLKKIKKSNTQDINKDLYIYGRTGTGKTLYSLSLAYLLLKDIRTPMTSDCLVFINISDLLISIKQSYKKSQSNPHYGIQYDDFGIMSTYEERIMNKCKYAKCLIMDDFGTGKSTDWTNEILFSIINNRYNTQLEGQSTIITSNSNTNELSKKVDDRIVSRILDMCKVILFKKVYRKV